MDNIFDRPGLIINDSYGRRTFSRIIGNNGIPNYYEIGTKPSYIEEQNINEVLLLPLTMKDYDKRRKAVLYGYKYVFSLGQHDIMKIDDNYPLQMSHVQLCVEVHRFAYTINKKGELVVAKVYDSVYPTRMLDIQCLTMEVGKYILTQTIKIVDEYNDFYLNRAI